MSREPSMNPRMEDEPSKPMDQEEDDNEEYFSAKESRQPEGNNAQTPQKSDGESPLPDSMTPKKERPLIFKDEPAIQQTFFKDECAQHVVDDEKSKKVRRLLTDRWDTKEYNEDLEKLKKKKKKSKKKKSRTTTEGASKTDDSDDNEEAEEPARAESNTLQPRPYFQSTQWLAKPKFDAPPLPKSNRYGTIRFQKSREVVEYDADGEQPQLPKFTERAISNPWRKWGAHKALCEQGGYQVVGKKTVAIERGSNPPPRPKNKQQITLNKNMEIPDSQSLSGSLKVGEQDAEEEGHKIAKQVEEYVNRGGFVPAAAPKKDPAVKPKQQAAAPTPVVVVQTKVAPTAGQKDNGNVKPKKKKARTPKGSRKGGKGKRSSLSDDSDSVTEDGEGNGPKGSKNMTDESSKKKGAFSKFFNRRKTTGPAPTGPPKAAIMKDAKTNKLASTKAQQ